MNASRSGWIECSFDDPPRKNLRLIGSHTCSQCDWIWQDSWGKNVPKHSLPHSFFPQVTYNINTVWKQNIEWALDILIAWETIKKRVNERVSSHSLCVCLSHVVLLPYIWTNYRLLVYVCGWLVARRVEPPLLMENRLRPVGSRLAHSLPYKSSSLMHWTGPHLEVFKT